jgi:hypothetical protein
MSTEIVPATSAASNNGLLAMKALPARFAGMNLYEQVFTILDERFVQVEKLARALALAIASGKNLLLWGPGGHGKSEMVQEALKLLFHDDDLLYLAFGEGTDEATLWGGLNFKRLNDDGVLEYFPERSFLARKIAIFEEIFDGPPVVLTALKDTLTSGFLRKGAQIFRMETRLIIGLTNKDPRSLAEMGPEFEALIQRFPLQLEVKWPSYTAADYLRMFEKVERFLGGARMNGNLPLLAEVIAKAGEGQTPISPRTAVHALGLVKRGAAEIRGAEFVERQDLLDLQFLPGMEVFARTLQAELDKAAQRAAAESRLNEAEVRFKELKAQYDDAVRTRSPIKIGQAAKRMQAFVDEVADLTVTDGLTERRTKLRESASELAQKGVQATFDAIQMDK